MLARNHFVCAHADDEPDAGRALNNPGWNTCAGKDVAATPADPDGAGAATNLLATVVVVHDECQGLVRNGPALSLLQHVIREARPDSVENLG
jgi:hypothetical protein